MGQKSSHLRTPVWLPVSHHTALPKAGKKKSRKALLRLSNPESNQDFQNQNLT